MQWQWQPTPVLLPGKSHGRRRLVGFSPWGLYESDTTERLHFHFSLSCIGEGNGNPLQCSCLENPRDGGAWWAAVYGVTQSRTQLKWLSSSMQWQHTRIHAADASLLSHVLLSVAHGLQPTRSPARGVFQARVLERGAFSYSQGSFRPRDRTSVYCIGRWILYH